MDCLEYEILQLSNSLTPSWGGRQFGANLATFQDTWISVRRGVKRCLCGFLRVSTTKLRRVRVGIDLGVSVLVGRDRACFDDDDNDDGGDDDDD